MSSMEKSARIYVAGHRGLVGSALVRALFRSGYKNLVTKTHDELDLTSQAETEAFFALSKPDFVILAAAVVGGIHANNAFPASFIRDNLAIEANVVHAAWKNNVKRLLLLGSSCIYPKFAPQPLKEEYLLTGELEPTNRPYAVAKIAGIEMCWAYNRQYRTRYLAVMPTNLYGPGDNYHPENSHVIPGLLRRFHGAKLSKASRVVVWGTGTPKREFLYSDDMADACVHLMGLPDPQFVPLLAQDRNDGVPPVINIGSGTDLSIRELAEVVRTVVGYDGEIEFDHTKPDGTPRKVLDVTRLQTMGWKAKTDLHEGLHHAYREFLKIEMNGH